jgi:hypothetical protein
VVGGELCVTRRWKDPNSLDEGPSIYELWVQMEGSIDEGIEVERSREKAGEVAEERTQGNKPVARAMNIERNEPCA